MGKRSNFEHKKLAFYPTPYAAVKPLLRHLPQGATFCEPCAGAGDLIKHLQGHATCTAAYDVDPQVKWIEQLDASFLVFPDLKEAEYIITNPPWERDPLHQIIERCASLAPTWLLFDADWMHTRQSADYMAICVKIISVGRVKWIEGSDSSGKDNCCWYLFDTTHKGETAFWGRQQA